MSDIVERLRYEGRDISSDRAAMREAADEIERLRALHENAKHWEAQWLAENERLRAALSDARDALRDFEPDNQSRAWRRANNALEQKARE